MLRRQIQKTIIGCAVVFSGILPALADSVSMPTANLTSQPIGHYDFCRANPEECSIVSSGRPAALTNSLWRILHEVNNQTNISVIPRTDMEIWGRDEVWSYPKNVGDCEDYVLLKRKRLLEQGIAPRNLLITVVEQMNGEGHAVLTIRTDRGDFILDNLEPRILPWDQTNYRYLKRQSEHHAGRWVAIEDSRFITVGSVR